MGKTQGIVLFNSLFDGRQLLRFSLLFRVASLFCGAEIEGHYLESQRFFIIVADRIAIGSLEERVEPVRSSSLIKIINVLVK